MTNHCLPRCQRDGHSPIYESTETCLDATPARCIVHKCVTLSCVAMHFNMKYTRYHYLAKEVLHFASATALSLLPAARPLRNRIPALYPAEGTGHFLPCQSAVSCHFCLRFPAHDVSLPAGGFLSAAVAVRSSRTSSPLLRSGFFVVVQLRDRLTSACVARLLCAKRHRQSEAQSERNRDS